MKVEICANSFESAKAAELGGADRIELCSDLSVGGLTPSEETLIKVRGELDIPVHVLLRPREGDFVYSEEEFDAMLNSIVLCKSLGCHGIVSGCLTPEFDLDVERTRTLIEAASGMEFTFHRAFDVCRDPKRALDQLIVLGTDRLLSSGQQPRAVDGLELLESLKELASEEIEIMPGAGINHTNAAIFKAAGFESIHLSAVPNSEFEGSDFFSSDKTGISDINMIRKVVKIARST